MKLIQMLRIVGGRNDKERLLSRATPTEKRVLAYAYNPYKTYGVTNLPVDGVIGEPSEEMFCLLDKLANRQLTGNSAYSSIISFAKAHGNLICLICRKSLDCGISAITINNALPGTIPVFKVQLAKEVPLNSLTYPLLAQIKYDGVRLIARTDIISNDCELLTRNGKTVNCPELSNLILAGAKQMGIDIVLDGEIVYSNGDMTGRTKISGAVNSAIHGGTLSMNGVAYKVFDAMHVVDFDRALCDKIYSQRLVMANNWVNEIAELGDGLDISLAETVSVSDAIEANNYYSALQVAGYEGIVLKSPRHLYTFKRSKDWVKVKAIHTADLKCIEVIPGKPGTKYSNAIGALLCVGQVDGINVTVNVGSGLTDNQRYLDQDLYIGRTIEVAYNSVIQASTEGHTLFLPRFIQCRCDK